MYNVMYTAAVEKAQMAQKVRKQIYIEPKQEDVLKNYARKLQLSEAELIRQGIDLVLAHGVSSPSDARAWESELKFLRKRAKTPALGSKRSWTREEVYEDRLSG